MFRRTTTIPEGDHLAQSLHASLPQTAHTEGTEPLVRVKNHIIDQQTEKKHCGFCVRVCVCVLTLIYRGYIRLSEVVAASWITRIDKEQDY